MAPNDTNNTSESDRQQLSRQTWLEGLQGPSKGRDQAEKDGRHQNDEPGCCRKATSSGVDSRPRMSLRCG